MDDVYEDFRDPVPLHSQWVTKGKNSCGGNNFCPQGCILTIVDRRPGDHRGYVYKNNECGRHRGEESPYVRHMREFDQCGTRIDIRQDLPLKSHTELEEKIRASLLQPYVPPKRFR